ncbi:MAG: amino acid ABC transporter permease [Anaerolineae bacterium]|nr:amino acid ABC transporter permease [Anaerolineae bacterium]
MTPDSYKRIYTQDTPRRHAPVASTGLLGWLRHNLFRSWFDTILTLIAGVLVVNVLIGFLQWSIADANWYSVLRNLSNLMIGSMQADPAAIDRVNLMTLVLAFGIGVSLRAWSRVGLRGWGIVALLAAVIVAVPALTNPLPKPDSVIVTGSLPVVSGSVTETPINTLAFIGGQGETVSVRLASTLTASDEALSRPANFGDRASDALFSAARARLASQARLATIEASLQDTALPDNERAVLTSERDTLSAALEATVIGTYRLDAGGASVRILANDGITLLAEATLTTPDDQLTFTLPSSGWYVLQNTATVEGTNVLLAMNGIYPALERSFTRPSLNPDGSPVLDPRTNQPRLVSITQHARVTDDFAIAEPVPKLDGADATRYLFVNNAYRGSRPLNDYLVLHLGPFVERTGRVLLPILGLVALGYALMQALDRVLPPTPPAPKLSRRVAFWMWALMPIVIYIIIASTNPQAWGGLFLTFLLTAVGIVVSFPIGVLLALGRRADDLPVVKYFCILVIEFVRGVPLITVLFLASLALPLVNPALSEVPGAVRAMVAITIFSAAYLAENVRGGLQSIPPGQVEAAKALGMNPVQVTLRITLPQALRAVIPALVGQCISLFKDTSLVAIVGLATYLFISIVYFIFSFVMAYVSRKIEDSGSGVARQVKL